MQNSAWVPQKRRGREDTVRFDQSSLLARRQGMKRHADDVALGREMSDSATVAKLYEHEATARSTLSP